MKFRLTISASLSIVLGFAVLFGLTSILRVLNLSSDEEIAQSIPLNSNFVTVVKGTEVLRKTVFTVLMEARDEELIEAVNEVIRKKRAYKGPSRDIGLDFLNNFALFGVKENNTQLLGMVIDIKKMKLFEKNKANYFDSTAVYANNDHQLVLLRKMNGLSFKKTEIDHYKKYAQQLLREKNKANSHFFNLKEAGMIHLYTNQGLFGPSSVFQEVKLNIDEEPHRINVTGDFKLNPNFENRPDNIYTFERDGFHFRSQIIPKSLQDTLQRICEEYGLYLPRVAAITLNYRNTDIQNTNEGLRISPELDLLLTFEKEVDFKEAITNVGFLVENGWEVKNDKLTNGVFEYNIRQFNPKTVLVSSKAKDIKVILSPKVLFEISGAPIHTTQLSGNSFIVGFIKMFNKYKSFNTLFESIDYVDLRITEAKNKELNLNGTIDFKDEHYPMNELLKFAISSEFINLNR